MKAYLIIALAIAFPGNAPLHAQNGTQITPDLSMTPPVGAPAIPFNESTAAQWNNVYVRYLGPYAGKPTPPVAAARTGPSRGDTPQYTPPFLTRWKKIEARHKAGHEVSGQAINCQPPGMPTMLSLGYPGEFIFRPGIINLIYEYTGVRRVHTDGRKFPDYIEPSYRGYSIGHWEGDALVIETRGITENHTLDSSGAIHSDVMTVFERWTSGGPGILINTVRVEDAKAFVKPLTFIHAYRIAPNEEVNEYYCLNNREGTDGIG